MKQFMSFTSFNHLRPSASQVGGIWRRLRRPAGGVTQRLVGDCVRWLLGHGGCPGSLQTAAVWHHPQGWGTCILSSRRRAHLAERGGLRRWRDEPVGVSLSRVGTPWLLTQRGCVGHVLRYKHTAHAATCLPSSVHISFKWFTEVWKTSIWVYHQII